MKAIASALLIGGTMLIGPALLAREVAGGRPSDGANETANERDGFVVRPEPGQLSASNLVGTILIGPGGQRVGTVNDMLIDTDGRLAEVSVDVGDFLGVATRTVAIPARSLRLVPAASVRLGDGTALIDSSRVSRDLSRNASAPGGRAGLMGDPTTNGRYVFSPSIEAIDHIEVDFTRQQLEHAPEFEN